MNSTHPSRLIEKICKILSLAVFIFIFLAFLPQEALAVCSKKSGNCPTKIPVSCGCIDCGAWGLPPDQHYCWRSGSGCNETWICDCWSDPCSGPADVTPPVCHKVIPRTLTGGFSSRSLCNPGFEDASGACWNIFNGGIHTKGGGVAPAFYCCEGYCATRPPHSGSNLLFLGLNGGAGAAIHQIGVTPNHVYRVSVWGMGSKCSYEDCWAGVKALLTAESGGVERGTTVADPAKYPTWQQGSVTIWANSNTLTVTLKANGEHCWHNSAGAVFDDLTIEEMPTSNCTTPNDCLLEIYATDDHYLSQMRFSNDKVNWSAYEDYNPLKFNYSLGTSSRVWAQFRDGAWNESAISDACSGTCAPPCPIPAAPSNITATPTCNQGIQFNWQDNSSNETGFKIVKDNFWNVIGTVGPNTTSWYYNWCADQNLHNYNVYSYINCPDGSVNENRNAPGVNAICPACCPSAPTIRLESGPEADDDIIVRWDDVVNNTSYTVERTFGGQTGTTLGLGADATSYTDTNAKSCGTYSYRVAAVRSGCPLAWSGPRSIEQSINAPSNASATLSGFNINLRWIDNSAIENRFYIQRRKGDKNTWTESDWTFWTTAGASPKTGLWIERTDTSQVCGGASPPKNVQYQVRCERTDLGCTSIWNRSNIVDCPTPSCTVTLSPPSLSRVMGEQGSLSSRVVVNSGSLNRVVFYALETDIVTKVEPTTSYSLEQIVTITAGTKTGSTPVKADVYLDPGNTLRCSASSTITVTSPGPWFQTQGGDVHGQGGISDPVPAGEYFCKDSSYTPAYPGVVSYFSAVEPGFAPNRISSKGWLARSSTLLQYNFDYFYNLLDSPTENWPTGNISDFPVNPGTGETEIVYTTNPAHLPGFTNLSGRKIIVLTSNNAIIENNITLASNGFLAVIAAQHINISNSVSKVQGVYIAGSAASPASHISTGTGTVQFEGQGIFYAPKLELFRDLDPSKMTNANINPAETFIFRPDLVINTPKELRVSKMSWQEVAP